MRYTGGRNGVGAKATNAFSRVFEAGLPVKVEGSGFRSSGLEFGVKSFWS